MSKFGTIVMTVIIVIAFVGVMALLITKTISFSTGLIAIAVLFVLLVVFNKTLRSGKDDIDFDF